MVLFQSVLVREILTNGKWWLIFVDFISPHILIKFFRLSAIHVQLLIMNKLLLIHSLNHPEKLAMLISLLDHFHLKVAKSLLTLKQRLHLLKKWEEIQLSSSRWVD